MFFMSLYGFAGRCLSIQDVCMNFEPCFKVHKLVSVYPKSIKLGQMTTLKATFHVVCQFIDWLKFETRPSSLHDFGMAYIPRHNGGRSSEAYLGINENTSLGNSFEWCRPFIGHPKANKYLPSNTKHGIIHLR